MPRFELRTLGEISLTGPSGTVALDEPRLVALLALLALSDDPKGVAEDDLLLRLLPDAKPDHARVELARLLAVLRLRLGGESAIARTAAGYALAPGLVGVDARLAPEPHDGAREDFLPGFRLPGSPEFRDWLADARRRVEPRAVAAPAPTWRAAARRTRVVAALALLVIVVFAAAYFSRPRGVEGFNAGDPIVLADVRNETGDSVFESGLLTAATVGLQQSSRLRLYPRSRLPQMYALMEIANRDTALTFELAQDVAERDGVRFVLGLRIDREDDGYRVSSQLADVGRQHVLTSSAFSESKAGVVNALDRVLRTVRRQLGESRRELAERSDPLPVVTTSSLEALRSYADGAVAWNHGNYPLAAELWDRAVDLDSGFAMAHSALGRLRYHAHDRDGGAVAYSSALAHADRLTEFERLRLRQSWASSRGDLDSAVAVSRAIAERFPNGESWFNYGTSLMLAARNAEAEVALRRALTFDTGRSWESNLHINLATVLARLHRLEPSLAAYHQAEKVDSGALYRNNINHEYGIALVRLGRLAEAETAYEKMASGPSLSARGLGLRSLGFLAYWRGRLDEAADYYGRAIAANKQGSFTLSEARNRLLLSSTYRMLGRPADANRQLDSVLRVLRNPALEPRFFTFVVMGLVKQGRLSELDSVMTILRTKVDRRSDHDLGAEAYFAGMVHLARNRPDSALVYARRAAVGQQLDPRLALELAAFRAMGQRDSARAVIARLHEDTGFGYEGQEDQLYSRLWLGDLLLAEGDTAGAVKSYQLLVDQWRDAPPGVPLLVEVRSRLAALRWRAR